MLLALKDFASATLVKIFQYNDNDFVHINDDDDNGQANDDDDSVSKDSFCCKGEPMAINARSTKKPTLLKELKGMMMTMMITMIMMNIMNIMQVCKMTS